MEDTLFFLVIVREVKAKASRQTVYRRRNPDRQSLGAEVKVIQLMPRTTKQRLSLQPLPQHRPLHNV